MAKLLLLFHYLHRNFCRQNPNFIFPLEMARSISRSETKAQQVNPTRGDNFKILWPRRMGAPLFWPHPSYFYILVRRNIYQSLFQIQSAADSLRDTAAETRWDLKLRSRSNWRLMKTKLTLLKSLPDWFVVFLFPLPFKNFFSKYRVLIFIRLFVGRKILIKIGRIST